MAARSKWQEADNRTEAVDPLASFGLLIHAVADKAAGDQAGGSADQSPYSRIAVVGQGADGSTRSAADQSAVGCVVGLPTGRGAAGQQAGQSYCGYGFEDNGFHN